MIQTIDSLIYIYKKLSWCWQTRATHLEVSQKHDTSRYVW